MNIIWSVKNLLLGGTKDLLPNEHWLIAQAIQFLPEQVSAVLKNEVHNISWVQRHNGNRIVHIFLNKKITNLITKFDLPCDEYYVACVEHMVGKKNRSSKIGTYKGLLCSIESRGDINLKDLKNDLSLIKVKTKGIKQKGMARTIDRFEHDDR